MDSKSMEGVLSIDVCTHCKKVSSKKCSDCQISSYCSQRCQKLNRKQHRNLIQCSKDNKTEMKAENKVMFEEILDAQALLCYAFLGAAIDFGNNEEYVRDYLDRRKTDLIPSNCPINIEAIHKVALETKIFSNYKGNVFYLNTCFGLNRGVLEGHFPTQNPVLISTGDVTAEFTPKFLLEKLSGAVVVEYDHEIEEFENEAWRPILACGDHKDIEEISLYQMRNGILIMTNCI